MNSLGFISFVKKALFSVAAIASTTFSSRKASVSWTMRRTMSCVLALTCIPATISQSLQP